MIDAKWFTKDVRKYMILENLKQYALSVIIVELILLIYIQRTTNFITVDSL